MKTHFGVRGSLALRVLLISFIFIILPLILYALLLFFRDFKEEEMNIFDDLELIEKTQSNYLKNFESSVSLFLRSVDRLVEEVVNKDKSALDTTIDYVFKTFVEGRDLTAISFLQKENGTFRCIYSTSKEYQNQQFPLEEIPSSNHEGIFFVDTDPAGGKSFYIVIRSEIEGSPLYLMANVNLKKLLFNLKKIASNKQLNTTVILEKGEVYATTNPLFEGKVFSFAQKKGAILLQPYKGTSQGLVFNLNKPYFAVATKIPNTQTYLLLTIPRQVVLENLIGYIQRLVFFLLFILIIGSLFAYLLTLRMAKPLKNLRGVMTEVGKGRLDQRYTHDAFGFEINLLGEHFNAMVESLKHNVEEMQKERAQREVYQKEMDIARGIQNSMLPETSYEDENLQMLTHFQAAKEVAGDYFDWVKVGQKIFFIVGDGVGKGVSTALYSFDLRSILRSTFIRGDNLKDMVSHANYIFCLDTKDSGAFVTAFLGIYDLQSHNIEYVNMGHEAPFLLRTTGEVEALDQHSIPFGINSSLEVKTLQMQLGLKEILFIFSDGLTDQKNEQGQFFGKEKLKSFLNTTSKNNLVASLIKQVEEFAKNVPQYDDITIMALERKK